MFGQRFFATDVENIVYVYFLLAVGFATRIVRYCLHILLASSSQICHSNMSSPCISVWIQTLTELNGLPSTFHVARLVLLL